MNCESLINSLSLKMFASTLRLSPPASVTCSCCHFRHFRSALQTFLPLRPSSAQILPFFSRRQLAARRRFQMSLGFDDIPSSHAATFALQSVDSIARNALQHALVPSQPGLPITRNLYSRAASDLPAFEHPIPGERF